MLGGGAGEVERDLVAADGRGETQLEIATVPGLEGCHPSRFEDVDGTVCAVGDLRDPRPRPALRVVEGLAHSVTDGFEPEALHELAEAGGAGGSGCELGAEVGAALAR